MTKSANLSQQLFAATLSIPRCRVDEVDSRFDGFTYNGEHAFLTKFNIIQISERCTTCYSSLYYNKHRIKLQIRDNMILHQKDLIGYLPKEYVETFMSVLPNLLYRISQASQLFTARKTDRHVSCSDCSLMFCSTATKAFCSNYGVCLHVYSPSHFCWLPVYANIPVGLLIC